MNKKKNKTGFTWAWFICLFKSLVPCCVFVVMKTQALLVCCFYVHYYPKATHTNYKDDAAIGGPGFDITARPPFDV